MSAPIRHDEIETAASDWFVQLGGGITPERRAQFEQWRDADPRHRVAYLRIQHAWEEARRIAALRRNTTPVTGVSLSGARWAWTLRLQMSIAAAAAIVFALVAGWKYLPRQTEHPVETYVTAVGESRTITLPDGSVAHLNTDTALAWIGSDRDRLVRLKSGEALFEVVHDSSRPFRVVIDLSVIHDLGTKFDVYNKANGNVVVTVLDGAVAVEEMKHGTETPLWRRQLTADQQLEYTSDGAFIADLHPTDGSRAIQWRDGVLEARNDPLPAVIAELNRYSKRPIRIAEPKLNSARIGGVFRVDDIDATLRHIQHVAPINITHTADGIVLTHRPEPATRVPPGDTADP